MHDSFPHALELSKKGYNAFALIYRPGAQTACEDLARAIRFIFENAEMLEVDTSDYSLWGGSAGGRMAAWVGSYGTAAFGETDLPRPAAVILQYTGHSEYSEMDPPTYAWRGRQRRHCQLAADAAAAGAAQQIGHAHGVSRLCGTGARFRSGYRHSCGGLAERRGGLLGKTDESWRAAK